MKRTLLIAGALALCTGAMAQNKVGGGRTFTYLPTMADPQEEIVRTNDFYRGGGQVVLWSDDFSGGSNGPGGITTNAGAWTTSNTNGNIWKHSNFGPSGCFSDGSVPNFFSTDSGFLLFDADSANCIDPDVPEFNENEWVGSITSPLIDLSFSPNVVLMFNYSTRWCCSAQDISVSYSNDGGNTWSSEFPIVSPLVNDQLESTFFMNASTFVGGSATTRFRVTWNSTSHYHLMIDDAQFVLPNDDDIVMNYALTSSNSTAEEYARIPFGQTQGDILFGAEAFNFGINSQVNVALEYSVTATGSSTELIGANFPASSPLNTNDTVVLQGEVDITSLSVGRYTVDFSVVSDGDALGGNFFGDNSKTRYFALTDTIYAVDGLKIGNNQGNNQAVYPTSVTPVTSSLGTASFNEPASRDNLILMTYYDIKFPALIRGIQVQLMTGMNGSEVDGSLIASILDTVDVWNDVTDNPIVESEIYDISSPVLVAPSNGTIVIPLIEPIELQPNAYFAAVRLFSNSGENNVVVMDDLTVPQPYYQSMIYIDQDQVYSNGNALAIRLYGDFPTGITEEDDAVGFVVFPNPANETLNISFRNGAELVNSLTIMTIDGQVVSSHSLDGNMGGKRIGFDISTLSNGIYLARISGPQISRTVKFTVVR